MPNKENLNSLVEDIVKDIEEENLFDDLNDIDEEETSDELELIKENKEIENDLQESDSDIEKFSQDLEIENKDLSEDEKLDKYLASIVVSSNYPVTYPTIQELKDLKKKHETLFILEIGGIVEKISFDTDVKLYICTTLKKDDYKDFSKTGLAPEEFEEFMIEKCVLHPKLTLDDVKKLSAGEYFNLLQHINSRSYLNGDSAVIKV